ncbi:MAG: aldehyde dehydrogenase family protein [Pseudomonadota bacterium]|nr:aldehyde dehydrogenase family protein [Pseudomonadota bacterium]
MNRNIQVTNPYNGSTDYSFNEPDSSLITQRCELLKSNQPSWASLQIQERIEALNEFGEAINRNNSELIKALQVDTGRSHISRLEVQSISAFIKRLSNESTNALEASTSKPSSIQNIEGSTLQTPYGLVGNISPWNFPIILSFLDTLPALVSGNAVIIKPSEVTPRWIKPMLKAIGECPKIAEVLDIIPGTGNAGKELINHIDALVFTGGVSTGKKVAVNAAKNFIPAFLELGGKDPAVILASADVKKAAETIVFCACQCSGQACQSLERIYVHHSLHDEFLKMVIHLTSKLELNYPDIDKGVIGPFILRDQANKVKAQIDSAIKDGAILHCGGELINNGGIWMSPAVLTQVNHDMELMQQETFGPVIPITPFKNNHEAINLANDSKYGLSASVFAGTLEEARNFGSKIKAGAISLNDASLTALIHEFEHNSFGFSGMGASRSGLSSYTRFTRAQSIMANTSENGPLLKSVYN